MRYCDWYLCIRPWTGDFGGRHISGGRTDVFGFVSADRLWLLLSETLKEVRRVKIVIWKAPKLLRGILVRIFAIQE